MAEKGIADALVKATISHAKSRVIQLHATVVTTNQAALRFDLALNCRTPC